MIRVICKNEKISYNAYHLTKAFLPKEQVEVKVCPEQLELILVMNQNERMLYVPETSDILAAEKNLYRQLSEVTGIELPWGILTGVRPTKLASRQLGFMSEEEFINHIGMERLVSPQKARLSWDIAVKEKKMIEDAGQGWSLYVNVPICPSKCSYCSFSSGLFETWKNKLDAYVDSVIKEINGLDVTGNPTTVYIGGGTPTVLEVSSLERLLDAVNERFSGYKEFTLEAGRPDTITEEKLKVAKAFGVTRISINPQTMQQKTLDLVGRNHKVAEVYEKFSLARGLGFNNINMDVIAGLPGENESDTEDTLRQIETLNPDSLTVHALAIKRAAKMESQSTETGIIENMIKLGGVYAEKMGMEPYYLYRQKSIAGNLENVGYAKPGCEGLYNVLIMEEVQTIIGVGAGASTKILLSEPIIDPKRGGKHLTNIIHKNNESDIGKYITLWT